MLNEKEKDWVNRMHRWYGSALWRRQDVRNILLFCHGDRYRAGRMMEDFIGEQGQDGKLETLVWILFSQILELEERIECLDNPGTGIFG